MPSLIAILGLDSSGFTRNLKAAERYSNQAGNKIASALGPRIASALSVTALVGFVKEIIELGSQINDTAVRLGISTDMVQQLGFAAKQSGSDMGSVTSAMTKLQKAMVEATSGSSAGREIAEAFRRLGVTVEELEAADASAVFQKIAESMGSGKITAQQTSDVLKTMGKSAGELIPVLKELAEKMQEFSKSGIGLDPQSVKDLDEAGDKLQKFWMFVKSTGARSFLGLGKLPEALSAAFFEDPANMTEATWKTLREIKGITERDKTIAANKKLATKSQEPPTKDELKAREAFWNSMWDLSDNDPTRKSEDKVLRRKGAGRDLGLNAMQQVGAWAGANVARNDELNELKEIKQNTKQMVNTLKSDGVTF